jgi:DNA-binding NtrC family response regulator
MTNEDGPHLQEQTHQQYTDTTDVMMRSMRAWNELMAASTDMAFDVVLKNWDYSRSLRGSAEQAIADAIKLQKRMNREMMQAWEGYSSEVKEILDRSVK